METAGAACGMAAQVAPPAADTDSERRRERERERERQTASGAERERAGGRTQRALPKFTHALSAASLLHSMLMTNRWVVLGARELHTERAREKEAPRARALCSAPVQLNTKSWSAECEKSARD
jgi:hypothetical protein